jgi:hypothetical protein
MAAANSLNRGFASAAMHFDAQCCVQVRPNDSEADDPREELPPLRAPRAGPAGGGTLRNFAMAREPEPCSVYGNGLSAGVRTSRAHTLTAPELEFVVRDVNRGAV